MFTKFSSFWIKSQTYWSGFSKKKKDWRWLCLKWIKKKWKWNRRPKIKELKIIALRIWDCFHFWLFMFEKKIAPSCFIIFSYWSCFPFLLIICWHLALFGWRILIDDTYLTIILMTKGVHVAWEGTWMGEVT